MINAHEEEQACLYVLGALQKEEAKSFDAALELDRELEQFTQDLRRMTIAIALISVPAQPPPGLKTRLFGTIGSSQRETSNRFRDERILETRRIAEPQQQSAPAGTRL